MKKLTHQIVNGSGKFNKRNNRKKDSLYAMDTLEKWRITDYQEKFGNGDQHKEGKGVAQEKDGMM